MGQYWTEKDSRFRRERQFRWFKDPLGQRRVKQQQMGIILGIREYTEQVHGSMYWRQEKRYLGMTVDVNKFNSVKQLVLTLSTSHSDTSVFSLLEVCLFILFCIYMYYPSDFFNLVNSVDSNQTPRSAVYDVSLIFCCRYLLRYARHYWFSQKLIHLYQWAQSDPDMQCSFNSHRTFKKFPIKKTVDVGIMKRVCTDMCLSSHVENILRFAIAKQRLLMK